MNEAEAENWIADRFGAPAVETIRAFLDRVVAENAHQNLISPTSVETIWSRHAADSAQLLPLAPADWSSWIDIGTGGGFPGMIVALLVPDREVTLVEPRRKRAAFLQRCACELKLARVSVVQAKVETLQHPADVISARAVASVENLLQAARGCAKTGTTWLLPRGRGAERDEPSVAKLNPSMFHVEHSITDPHSTIMVIRGDGR